MAYVCVNKDGQELICPNYPERWGDVRCETSSPFGVLDKTTGKRYAVRPAYSSEVRKLNPSDLYYWEDMEMIEMGTPVYYTISLPKGTILKMIGRNLSWEDEPVEI